MTVISDKDRDAPLLETWADRLEQEMTIWCERELRDDHRRQRPQGERGAGQADPGRDDRRWASWGRVW